MKLVLDIFKVNLLASNQAYRFDNSNCIVPINVLISLPLRNTLVSSMKTIYNNVSDTSEKSLIKRMNKRGPKIEPCGTPQVTSLMYDVFLLKKAY